MEEAETLFIWSCTINCPHCDASQDGWVIDPRGTEQVCDSCNEDYKVPQDIKLSF